MVYATKKIMRGTENTEGKTKTEETKLVFC